MTKPVGNKTLWLDVDGVLLDYTKEFLKFAGLPPQEVKDYNLSLLFDEPEDCWAKMAEFTESTHFATLPCLESPVIIESRLKQLSNLGWDIRILTQVGGSEASRKRRVAQLTSLYGTVFEGIHFTNRGIEKVDWLTRNAPYGKNILIEDNPAVFKKPRPESLEVWAVLQTYNVMESNFSNVVGSSLSSLLDSLIEEEVAYVQG